MASQMIFDDLAQSFGRGTREAIELLGGISMFFGRVVMAFGGAFRRYNVLLDQLMRVGVGSLPIVLLASTFVGFIAAWMVQNLCSDIIPLTYLGGAVARVVLTDLGPAFTALILAGRLSAKLAAEIGTMKVTEQLDAMECLQLDPYKYLLAPRLMSGLLMTPVLMIFSFFFSIMSAQILASLTIGLSSATFYHGVRILFRERDVMIGLIKGVVYGGVVTLTGCYYGYYTTGGAVGVGESTKKAVVAACVLILILNLILNQILMR
jgi:phospholipid/cholesterol/gamma-HCH transport system permease protein